MLYEHGCLRFALDESVSRRTFTTENYYMISEQLVHQVDQTIICLLRFDVNDMKVYIVRESIWVLSVSLHIE